jgi:hypothetical protein
VLRLDARALSTYAVRTVLLGLILFWMWEFQMTLLFFWRGAPGLFFFTSIVWINVWIISLAALGRFASAITEEKEEACWAS